MATRPALDFADLPEDPVARREVFELRAVPSPEKPKLTAAREKRLAPTEEKSAQCYMHNEELTHKWHKLAERARKLRKK